MRRAVLYARAKFGVRQRGGATNSGHTASKTGEDLGAVAMWQRRQIYLTTLPAFRQEVQAFTRLMVPGATLARTTWMFGFHRRWVRRWEWDTLIPKPGPLPQTSHTAATSAQPLSKNATRLSRVMKFADDLGVRSKPGNPTRVTSGAQSAKSRPSVPTGSPFDHTDDCLILPGLRGSPCRSATPPDEQVGTRPANTPAPRAQKHPANRSASPTRSPDGKMVGMTTFDTDLVSQWFSGLLDPSVSATYSPWLAPTDEERGVLADGRQVITAALQWSELPVSQPPPSHPAAAVLQIYLGGLATGVAGARQTMQRSGEIDEVAVADRLCLVAGLIAGGAAVAVEPQDLLVIDGRPSAADLARAAGTAAAELVVDGADLHAIANAAAAAALVSGPPDGANRDPGYRARALIGLVLVGLQRSTAPAAEPIRPPSCGARPGVNGGTELLAEVTFTMFMPQEDADRLEQALGNLSEEVVLWSEGDRRYFHIHTRAAGEVIAESYAVGTVFSLVIGRLD